MRPDCAGSENIRVSFDLDEVLFVNPSTHKIETPPFFPLSLIFRERFRKGTPTLIRYLRSTGIEVWVYTSSYRTEAYIRQIFRLYHMKLDGVVNAQRHNAEVQRDRKEMLPQKMPSKYRISLHIDDETVIATYGREYGFDVFTLDAPDDLWAEKIIQRVDQIRENAGLMAHAET